MKKDKAGKRILPLLPLRDTVVFPGMVAPLLVGREKSVEALEQAMQSEERDLFMVAQKKAEHDDPAVEDLYQVGVIGGVLQMIKTQNGVMKVLVEGRQRASLSMPASRGARKIDATMPVIALEEERVADREQEALQKQLQNLLQALHTYAQVSDKIPDTMVKEVRGIDDPGRVADMVAGVMPFDLPVRQDILEELRVLSRLEKLTRQIHVEIGMLDVDKRVRSRVRNQMERSQREYYLNEKMKAIQKELGDMDGEGEGEAEQLERRLRESGMPKSALKKSLGELGKFRMMSAMSAEASVLRSYLDWLVNVPWKKRSRLKRDITHARRILDEDHYALDEVKDRVLEYLAVQKRVREVRGSILCLVGAPGVGKTSLGESIARATHRKFVRLSLGGVRDEAEIRGHRRTYIGSLPGKIIQKMAQVEVVNPLFLLDEVDKMGMDFRGDPASALLEVLDPEQNRRFNDHYLEVDYNLSEVMFICTANSLNIPPALLDRMELIRLPGYTEDEKMEIARRYLLPKAMRNCGLKENEIDVQAGAIRNIIRYYTREAGVRSLEREIEKICRKVVLEQITRKRRRRGVAPGAEDRGWRINSRNLHHYCGVRRHDYGATDTQNRIGQVRGLAWTNTGGDLLTIEAAVVPGKARQVLTGSLGDVMKESIQTAMSVVRSRAAGLGVKVDFLETSDVHVHVPEGATPKDGPSAGICMCTALLSALSKIPVRKEVAMTGEITLQGRVLPVGGLKEKLLAARRAGITEVVIPEENRKHLEEIPKNVLKNLDIKPVGWIDEALEIALERMPAAVEEDIAAPPPRRRSRKSGTVRAH